MSERAFDLFPVRVDATLCDPGEVWLENPKTGEAVRVYPPEREDERDNDRGDEPERRTR